MRVVFAPCPDPADEAADVVAAFGAVPGVDEVSCRPRPMMPLGRAVYVAYAEDQLSAYEAWFPGLGVRVRAVLRDAPLEPAGAMYLPVTYDSWCVVADGPEAFGAVIETARLLKGVRTVVCPAFEPGDVAAALASTSRRFRRWRDRVFPDDGA